MKPRGRLKEGKAIGICNYEYHPGDLNWEMIKHEGCLRGQCDHFSWLSFKDRDKWRAENGCDKRSDRQRADAAKKRAENKKICAPTPVEIIKKIEQINDNKPLTITITPIDGLCLYEVGELSLEISGLGIDDIKDCMLDYARELGIHSRSKATDTKTLIMKELYKLYKTSRSKYIQFLKLGQR